jgi:hypothetical protein
MTPLVKTFAKGALALCVLCATAFAQPKPKAAVYIMGNPEGRDAIRSAVNTFLVKSGKYQMIAVDAIDVVAQEQRRQMSGAVSDGDIAALGRDAGAQYVCVVQRSELDGVSYVATRMVSVQSKVAELADMTELPRGGKIIDMIQWQIGSMLGMPVGPRPAASNPGYVAPAQSAYTPAAQTAASGGTTSTIQGTNVPGGSLAQKLTWLQKSADSHTTYIIEADADESIAPYTFEFRGGINITVVLRGVGGNRTIRLSSHGTMFTVKKEVTFVLDNNITLHGHRRERGAMVVVENGGIFIMNNGSAIMGNIAIGPDLYGTAVWVGTGATFTMNGGTVSGNAVTGGGGGVASWGTFTMNGGIISGNTATEGGGVYVVGAGKFTMTGGIISGNTASNGGGVCVDYRLGSGGSGSGTFTMRGGTITGNIASESGGGVGRGRYGDFSKTGGTITGYKSDPTNGNVVRDEDGNVLARKGHAVYLDESKRKETTAGPGANFKDGAGPWDQ